MTPQRKRLIILVVGRIALAPTAIREKSPRTCTNWSNRRLPFTAPATGEWVALPLSHAAGSKEMTTFSSWLELKIGSGRKVLRIS
jgi:hypothetical protein